MYIDLTGSVNGDTYIPYHLKASPPKPDRSEPESYSI